MADYFRWKNCFADVVAGQYPQTVETFRTEVIGPSLEALDRQIASWNASADPIAMLHVSDLEDLRKATIEAFCLSIQSIWERQLREYVASAAREIAPQSVEKAKSRDWRKVFELFAEVRCISLREFAQCEALTDLQSLGNVCRHGNGGSLKDLVERRPELWPGPREIQDMEGRTIRIEPTVSNLVISRQLLDELSDSVIGFWKVVSYVYCESISPKDVRLERQLPVMRSQFAHQIQPNKFVAQT